ncbi:unnamed protein product [Rodentolepis nana]|uniref:Uncharacterized protein n=1 Tax=Rodentolepis nana TaxID=102285 RepID=A0A0R3TA86_RODNA|nr:unnamed protein product [Rodentolepis nana]
MSVCCDVSSPRLDLEEGNCKSRRLSACVACCVPKDERGIADRCVCGTESDVRLLIRSIAQALDVVVGDPKNYL